MRTKLLKHDKYVLELSDKIKENYDSIHLNVPLKTQKRSLGEVDIIARKGNRYDIYEVKCSFRITKARKQLGAIKKHLGLNDSKAYFYCGSSGVLVSIEPDNKIVVG